MNLVWSAVDASSCVPCVFKTTLHSLQRESILKWPLFMLGPFGEEEEGISIASDVVKVKGEDPATPGF